MKTNTLGLIALPLVVAVSLSCKLLQTNANAPYGIQDTGTLTIPTVAPDTPFPAMSADAINALIAEVPELAKHRNKILEAERAAINGLVVDVRAKQQASTVNAGSTNFVSVAYEGEFLRADDLRISLLSAAFAAGEGGPPAMPDMGGAEYFVIGHQAGFLAPDFEKAGDADRGKSETRETRDDSTGEIIATRTTSVGSDGSVSAEISTNINMPVFGLNANSKVKITGNQCPSSEAA